VEYGSFEKIEYLCNVYDTRTQHARLEQTVHQFVRWWRRVFLCERGMWGGRWVGLTSVVWSRGLKMSAWGGMNYYYRIERTSDCRTECWAEIEYKFYVWFLTLYDLHSFDI